MRQPLLIAVLVTGLLGCAAIPSPPEPNWVQEMREREAEPLPQKKIRSADRFFRARVPAKVTGAIERVDDAYKISSDIGTDAPVDCWVYREGLDFAASLSRMSDQSFVAIGPLLGKIDLRKIDRVDAGVIGESPFLAIDWMYRVKTGKGPQIGQIKHLVASKGGRAVYCQHNEVGYAKSFRRTVTTLLESLRYQEPYEGAPSFAEISTMSVKGMKVGVTHTKLSREGDGINRISTQTAMLIPITSKTLRASDTYEVEFARADGTLINQIHVASDNGEVVSHLKFDPQSGGVWTVEGTFQGKTLAKEITPTTQPSSWLGDALALRGLIAAGGTELTMTRWLPDADPTRLLDGTISIERQVGPERFAATLDAAGLEADLVVDRQGTVASGSLDMGVAKVDFERVYTGGAF